MSRKVLRLKVSVARARASETHEEEYLVLGEQHGGLAGGHDGRRGGRDAQRPVQLPQRGRGGRQVGAHERHQRAQRRARRAPRARPALQRRAAVRRHAHALLEELLHHLRTTHDTPYHHYPLPLLLPFNRRTRKGKIYTL